MDTSTMDKELSGKLDAYVQASAQAQAQQQSIAWEGQEVDIPESAAAAVSRARFEALEAASLENGVTDPFSLVRACAAYDKLMGSLESVADYSSRHRDSVWGKALHGWSRSELSTAKSKRNGLLVRMAALRVGVDGEGPWPQDEPAAGHRLSDEEARDFVRASQEYVGAGRVSLVSVARILDYMATQAMPQDDEKEQHRRHSAAAVLRYRGLRALFLARHQAHNKAFAEALALTKHAFALLEQSAAMVEANDGPDHPSQVSKREAQMVKREIRLLRVSAFAGSDIASDAPPAQEEQLPQSDAQSIDAAINSAKIIPGKPALFDLAGSEVKYPSIEGRVKKKGFFSSFW